MKRMIIAFAVFAMSFAASAQTTRVIKGAVIDKNGNPLPGATVGANGGSEVTTVDADGLFSMEVPIWLKTATAQYAGMKKKKLKVSDNDMIFRLKEKDSQWFIIANYTHRLGYESHANCNLGGLVVGSLGKWGWYGNLSFGSAAYNNYYYNFSIHEFAVNATVGVTKRIVNPLYAYLGFGAGKSFASSELTPELGVIFKIKKHFLINMNYQLITDLDGDLSHGIGVGLGYAF